MRRAGSSSDRGSAKARLELPSVVFETTSRCNLDCSYCYAIWKRPGAIEPPRASYRDSKRALARLFDAAKVGHVAMSGGEPFLSERFAELVLYCRMAGKAVTIISNGTAATREDYRQMVELGVRLFEFPLHASQPAVHDRMTGMPGSWQRAREAIESMLALGGPVATVIVVTRHNFMHVEETLLLLRALGVRRVLLNRFNVGGNGIRHRRALEPTASELNQAFAAAERCAADGGMVLSANVCTPWCVVDPRRYPHVPMSSCATDPLRMPLTLDAAGDLRLCNHSPVVVGNIHRAALDDLLRSEHARDWQRIVPAPCEHCVDWAACRGGCRAAAEQLGGTLRDADPAVAPVPTER